jgi:plastocyanin
MIRTMAFTAALVFAGGGALAQPRAMHSPHKVQIVSQGVYGPYSFSPKSISISKGQTVSWENGSGTNHHLKFTDGKPWAKAVPDGKTVTRTFNAKGRFHYKCTIHTYMKGSVSVT